MHTVDEILETARQATVENTLGPTGLAKEIRERFTWDDPPSIEAIRGAVFYLALARERNAFAVRAPGGTLVADVVTSFDAEMLAWAYPRRRIATRPMPRKVLEAKLDRDGPAELRDRLDKLAGVPP